MDHVLSGGSIENNIIKVDGGCYCYGPQIETSFCALLLLLYDTFCASIFVGFGALND